MSEGILMESHSLDECDCGATMHMTRTRYVDDGHDYLLWICSDETCGNQEDDYYYHDDPKYHIDAS